MTDNEKIFLQEIEDLKKKLSGHQTTIDYLQEELIKFRGYK